MRSLGTSYTVQSGLLLNIMTCRYHSGMGFSLLSFDWNQIAFIGSPLATPCSCHGDIYTLQNLRF